MNRKSTMIAGAAGLCAMSLLCTGEAAALNAVLRNTVGFSDYADTGVTPFGTVLTARLTLNGSGSVNDIRLSNSGNYSNRLMTLCPDNTVQDNTVVGSGTIFFDLVHFCAFGFAQPLLTGGQIDDL